MIEWSETLAILSDYYKKTLKRDKIYDDKIR